jgi:hypothetical protein
MKEYTNRYIKINFTDREPIAGLIQDFSDDWLLMRRVPVDYVIDGYALVRNKNIKEAVRSDEERWTEKVLRLKVSRNPRRPSIPLDSIETILKALTKKYEVFTLWTKKKNTCWLGRLRTIKGNQLTIDYLTTEAKWLGKKIFKPNEIRVIEFDNDYINSLKLVMKNTKAKRQT